MPGFSGVAVDALDDPRWELALDLIDSGEAPVRLGEVEIWRSTAGPRADGLIRLAVVVSDRAEEQFARVAVVRARKQVDAAASADPRFARLLDRYGFRWEVVADDGMGTVLLGELNDDGHLVWHS